MNDVHEGDTDYPYMMPEWKKKHPECLLGTPQRAPPAIGDSRAWCAVDYGRAEVRELAFRTIEEVCHRYDVDGVELDFFRHPFLFKRQGWGDGMRNTSPPGAEPPDTHTYDPNDPTSSAAFANGHIDGPRDVSRSAARQDVLVYSTAILEQDLEIIGPVSAQLFAATSAGDADHQSCIVLPVIPAAPPAASP
jgi:hypothetical protein